jgi:phage terminase large subunit
MLTSYASYLRKSDQEWSNSLPRPRKSYRRFHQNPDRFNTDILKRKAYWGRQREICRAIADPSIRTVLAITGNGVGKSYLGAGIALWYGQSHEPAKVLTTGPTFDQLRAVLWGNIFRAYHQSELDGTAISLRHDSLLIQWADEWFLKGINPDNIESASGYHGGNLIALVDEASALTAAKNEAIDSWDVAKKILFGNPLRPDGPFYELYQRHVHDPDPATCVIKIPSTESPAIQAGLRRSPDGFVGLDWLDDRRREYGEDSPWWKSHVLAEFPDTAEGQLVARDWIDRAVSTTVDSSDDRTEPILAIDLGAGRGGDRSVLLVRTGRRLIHLESSNRWDLEETARRAASLVQRFGVKPSRVVYDRSGLGEGFGALLRTAGIIGAIGFLGGAEARGYQRRFENLKSASAWQLRTRLNPEQSREPFAIPHEWAAQIRPELQAYTYEVTGKDKIKLTDKDTINARLGRSPDLADALIMSFVAIDRTAA